MARLLVVTISDSRTHIPESHEGAGLIDFRTAPGISDAMQSDSIETWAQRCKHDLLGPVELDIAGQSAKTMQSAIVAAAQQADCDGVVIASSDQLHTAGVQQTLAPELARIGRPLYLADSGCTT